MGGLIVVCSGRNKMEKTHKSQTLQYCNIIKNLTDYSDTE